MQIPNSGSRSRGSSLKVLRSIGTSRPGLIAVAAAVLGSGLALNWTSLVAIGAAPLILGVLPCAAMCAVGLCMPMGPKKKDASVIEAVASPVRRDSEPLVIEATARTQTVSSQSPHSLPNP